MTDGLREIERAVTSTGVSRRAKSLISREFEKLLGSYDPKHKKSYAALLAKVAVNKALQGSFPHLKEIIDRTEGKVPDRLAGADGGPVSAEVMLQGIARIYSQEETAKVEATLIDPEDVQSLPAPEQETEEQ